MTAIRTAGSGGRASSRGARCRAMLVAVAVLGVLALPALDLYLGQQDNGALPKSTDARQAYDGLTTAFGPGRTDRCWSASTWPSNRRSPTRPRSTTSTSRSPTRRARPSRRPTSRSSRSPHSSRRRGATGSGAVPGPGAGSARARQADHGHRAQGRRPAQEARSEGDGSRAFTHLRDDLEHTSGVKKVTEPLVNSSGTAAVLNVTPTTAPSDRATEQLVRRLRDDTIPRRPRART